MPFYVGLDASRVKCEWRSLPKGGLSLWVQLPQELEARSLYEAGLTRGIGSLPGDLLSLRGDHRHHLRLSYGVPRSDAVEDAQRTLGRRASAAAR